MTKALVLACLIGVQGRLIGPLDKGSPGPGLVNRTNDKGPRSRDGYWGHWLRRLCPGLVTRAEVPGPGMVSRTTDRGPWPSVGD